ncbi:MAG: FtsH protease activity modulator HflK [Treponema sp.]|nr:MAG: FtsH protease activity modulator HflK [Treponema sp.]
MKGKKLITTVLFLVIVGFLGFKSFIIIPPTDQGVVTRFGKYMRILPPGPQLIIPFVEKIQKVPVTVAQKEEFGFRTKKASERNEYESNITHESEMLTGDLNIINVEWVIQYKITDAKAWLFNVIEDQRNKTIRDVSKSVVNSLVGDRAILMIIGQERDRIQSLATTMMNEQYKKLGLGITVTSVQLQNVLPPEEVEQAFEGVNIAIQDMNRLINEGKEAYNKEIPKAKGEAARMIQEAEGYAAKRVNTAKGDVARFESMYAEYRKNPEITRRRLYLETVGEVLSNTENVMIVDKNLDNFLPFKDLASKRPVGGNSNE